MFNTEIGPALGTWMKKATRGLSNPSAAQVRTEIQQHYESAREVAMDSGATAHEADCPAVTALGDAKAANCQFRKVLLTTAEARMLRDGNWEAQAVCSRPWLKRLLPAIPVALQFAAAALFFTGAVAGARVLLAAGIGLGIVFAAPFLPIYTPSRARLSLREMGRADWNTRAGLRAGHAEILLAAFLVPMATCLDRVDPRFNPAQTARRGLAQAIVSVTSPGGCCHAAAPPHARRQLNMGSR
jgi:hypothetical protein